MFQFFVSTFNDNPAKINDLSSKKRVIASPQRFIHARVQSAPIVPFGSEMKNAHQSSSIQQILINLPFGLLTQKWSFTSEKIKDLAVSLSAKLQWRY